ncbi:hypothetical protein C461_12878 [Halorubrum aidingense JCM 13560]|uniref:Uncharacterized protein n=1 Tax=Halorubrum aidingense JCM 13560 TaxID=1230454 RepID=M0P897_9EURY|nr:hypothetical protein [Halorubrum aidingense]EMA66068.1 hypothetical protein C461_12878 [Halorubrum aidingense JCM 13560]
MNHDRIHAREPSHHVDRWSVGVIESIAERDGHCVVTVRPKPEVDDGAEPPPSTTVELVVTLAVRDLFSRRLPIAEGESPVGERVWYRKHGG